MFINAALLLLCWTLLDISILFVISLDWIYNQNFIFVSKRTKSNKYKLQKYSCLFFYFLMDTYLSTILRWQAHKLTINKIWFVNVSFEKFETFYENITYFYLIVIKKFYQRDDYLTYMPIYKEFRKIESPKFR